MKTAIRTALLTALLLAFGASLGCRHSLVSERWGTAVQEDTARMIAYPNAEKTAGASPDMDPATTETVMEGYYQAQKPLPGGGEVPSIIQIDAN